MNIIMKKLFALLLILLPIAGFAGDLKQKVWYHIPSLAVMYGDNGDFPSYPDGTTNVSKTEADAINAQIYSFWDLVGEQPDIGYEKPFLQSPREGGTGASEDCAVLQPSGLWHDYPCESSFKFACFDGYEWQITGTAGTMGTNGDTSEDTGQGDDLCALLTSANGQTGNFLFAAPNSWRETQRLKNVAGGNAWINIHDKKIEGIWVVNKGLDLVAPFWNANEPNNTGAAGVVENCAQAYEANGLWNDADCATSQRYICYSPIQPYVDQWKITAAVGTASDLENSHNVCQSEFGADYKFFAPRTLSEKELVKELTNPLDSNAWVNGNDIDTESVWRLNVGVRYWATDAFDLGGNCAQVNSSNGLWSAADCDQDARVLCSSGRNFQVTAATVNLSDYSAAQQACYDEFGAGINFILPRDIDKAEQLRDFLSNEGLPANTPLWLNANRILDGSTWQWNSTDTQIPHWLSSQPDGSASENCAIVAASGDDVVWSDEQCDSTLKNLSYVCSDDTNWQLSIVTGNLSSLSNGHQACTALGANWKFKSPVNLNENLALKAIIGGVEAWVNATDSLVEDSWILNIAHVATYPMWSAAQPDNGGFIFSDADKGEDCIFQDANGALTDVSCTANVTRSWACTNGPEWKVTVGQSGATYGAISQFADGHRRCFEEFGEGWLFAAPANAEEVMLLDQALELADRKIPSVLIDSAWLNMTDGAFEDEGQVGGGNGEYFRTNLPYTHWLGAYPGENPSTDCAFKTTSSYGSTSEWRTNNCTTKAAHYACFNGSNWEVAEAQGELVGGVLQVVPQIGVDYWSYERGNDLCKVQYGPAYFFSAPVLAEEEAALDNAIRALGAQVKNTWINYYQVTRIAARYNDWFANRTTASAWSGMLKSNTNNQDCTLSSSTGVWTDESCEDSSLSYAYACFNGDWTILGTGNKGQWENGFSVCDVEAGNDHLFAVPRSPQEKSELTAAIDASGETHVWVNYSDTSVESQWISNRLRFAWWADGEPSIDGNRDCATIDQTGNWYAQRCEFSVARFSCLDAGVWKLTTEKATWPQGFAICEKEYPGSEFDVPLHEGKLTATTENDALMGVVANAVTASTLQTDEQVWLNYSDRDVENSWRKSSVYSDWAADSRLDEDTDCAYLDRLTLGAGTWQSEGCKYTSGVAKSRGYACTNGFEWRVISIAPTTEHQWSTGFTACDTLDNASDDWSYAAPTTAYENGKLKLSMELASVGAVWFNAHDRITEGDWIINGEETNFPATIDLSSTLTSVNENTAGITLTADLADDEEVGIQSATWTLLADSRHADVTDSSVYTSLSTTTKTDGATGTAQAIATYATPLLLQEDIYLIFKLTVTDEPTGTASSVTNEATVEVKVTAPIIAWYDFDDLSAPEKDISLNNHDAINTQAEPLPVVNGGAMQMDGSATMRVPGFASDATNGLVLPTAEYTVAFRMRLEEDFSITNDFRGILQKGDAGDRQPGMFLMNTTEQLHYSNSTTTIANNGSISSNPIEMNQWVNVAYVKYATYLKYVVDGVVVDTVLFGGAETSVNNDGDLRIGNIPDAPAGFVGAIDDVQIYNRALSVAELTQALPAPPGGEINFTASNIVVNEDAGTVNLEFERSEGTAGIATIYYQRNNAASSVNVVEGSIVTATDVPDYELPAAYGVGGQQITWADGVKGKQTVSIALDSADDNLREGSERIVFELNNVNGATIGSADTLIMSLTDITPNPYGNFKITSEWTAPVFETVTPGSPGKEYLTTCIQRDSGSAGEVTVNYSVGGTAIAGITPATDNYQFLASAIIPAAATDSVVFADADSTDKCFHVEVYDHPTIYGESTKTVIIQITSVVPTTVTDEPLLTDEDSVELMIQDYSPGQFEIVDTSTLTCFEPNYSTAVVASRQPSNPAECIIQVRRINAGIGAPAASLSASIEAGTATPIDDFTFDASDLSWPAINVGDSLSIISETKNLVVSVVNDDVYEDADTLTPLVDDVETIRFKINATNGDGFDEPVIAANEIAQVAIQDVTTPALVTISVNGGATTMVEGEAITFDVSRSGNSNTAFELTYANDMLLQSPLVPNQIDHSGGTKDYTVAGLDTQSITIVTTDVNHAPATRTLEVELNSPAPDWLVGLGTLDNIGDAGLNRTSTSITVEDFISIQEDIVVSVTTDSAATAVPAGSQSIPANTAVGSGTLVEVTTRDYEPATRSMNLAFTYPKKNDVDVDFNYLEYSWTLDQPTAVTGYNNPATDTLFSGSRTAVLHHTLDPTTDTTYNETLQLPFVLAQEELVLTLTIKASVDTDFTTPMDTFIQTYRIKADPVWRTLTHSTGNCLVNVNLSDTGNCINADKWWAWHPTEKLLFNKQSTSQCFRITSGDSRSKATCSNVDGNQRFNFDTASRVRMQDDSEILCRSTTTGNLVRAGTGSILCSGSRDDWNASEYE